MTYRKYDAGKGKLMFLRLALLTVELRKGCPTCEPPMGFPDRICGCKNKKSSSEWETLSNMERRKPTNLFQKIFFIVAIMLLLIILYSHVN